MIINTLSGIYWTMANKRIKKRNEELYWGLVGDLIGLAIMSLVILIAMYLIK